MISYRAAARGLDSAPAKPAKALEILGFEFEQCAGFAGWYWHCAQLVLAGCATAPPSPEALAANDPYEQTNRDTLKLNGKIDKYFVIPTVGVYFLLVPEGGRRGVHNFLGNLSLPTIFVNDMLQGELSRAGKSMWRLGDQFHIGAGRIFRSRQQNRHSRTWRGFRPDPGGVGRG